MLQAALFDMDGLMLDTEPLWAQGWEPVLRDLGVTDIPAELPDELRGAGPAARQAVFDRHFGTGTIDQAVVWERLCAHILEACRDGAPKRSASSSSLTTCVGGTCPWPSPPRARSP